MQRKKSWNSVAYPETGEATEASEGGGVQSLGTSEKVFLKS